MLGKLIGWLKVIRLFLLKRTIWRRFEIGRKFHAGRSVVLWAPSQLKIGRDVYIGRNSQIECDALIGNYVIMANNVAFVGRYDHHYQQTGVPTRRAMAIRDPDYDWKGLDSKVEVGDDVWIGYGVVVLSGVKIGAGAIVAAGSVVTKDVEANSIYAGCPAKKVSDRFETTEHCASHWSSLRENWLPREEASSHLKKGRVDILLVGQKPPPYHGQAVVMGMLFDHHWCGKPVRHLYMEYSGSIDSIGKMSVAKISHLASLVLKTWWIALTQKPEVFYYLPASPARAPIMRDVIYLTLTRWLFAKTVFHYHAGGLAEFVERQGLLGVLARRAYGKADVSIELSPNGLSPSDYFAAKKRVYVPNGLDVAVKNLAVAEDDGVFRLMFLGALTKGKGVGQVIETAALLKQRGLKVHFNLVGAWADDAYKKQMLSAVSAHGLEGLISFSGVLIDEEKWNAFAAADCFFFPTHYVAESFPLVLIEAMACSLPLVTTRWRGIPNLVGESDCAILCDVESPAQYADAITTLAGDTVLRTAMGKAARARYEAEFTQEKFLQRMEDVFSSLCSESPKSKV